MTNKEKINYVIDKLDKAYPDARCSLVYSSAFELLIAARLSAQCTDARVNKVTPILFKKFKNPLDFAASSPDEIAKYIKSCGLYKTKSKSIYEACKKISDKFEGKVPDTFEELLSLPGIGRKTANLIMGEIYNISGIVVDTHVTRVTKRLGFHNTKNAFTIENILQKIVPDLQKIRLGHMLVAHGRAICTARSPKCDKCCLNAVCAHKISPLLKEG